MSSSSKSSMWDAAHQLEELEMRAALQKNLFWKFARRVTPKTFSAAQANCGNLSVQMSGEEPARGSMEASPQYNSGGSNFRAGYYTRLLSGDQVRGNLCIVRADNMRKCIVWFVLSACVREYTNPPTTPRACLPLLTHSRGRPTSPSSMSSRRKTICPRSAATRRARP